MLNLMPLMDVKLKTCKHCLIKILCNPASLECYLGEYLVLEAKKIKDKLRNAFSENII